MTPQMREPMPAQPRTPGRRPRVLRTSTLLATLAGATLLLAACKTSPPAAPSPHAADTTRVQTGSIRMPGGADLGRARLIAENRRMRIYTELVGIGDPANEKLLFTPAVAAAIGATPRQLQRRFLDTVAASRRFELYDASSTVTLEASDLVIDGQFTETQQQIQTIEGGVRVAVTRVRLSLQLKDRPTGKLLFPAPVEVVGQTGRVTGDRTVLAPSDRVENPEVQRRLGVDYANAMQRAFDDAAKRIDDVLRPMSRVLAVDGEQIGMVGGSTHGLQSDDELVIFRATTAKLGSSEVFASTRPVAVVRCDGVGTEQSQCRVIRRDPALTPAVGDYAILSDVSAQRTRAK